MNELEQEKLIEELVRRAKTDGGLLNIPNDPATRSAFALMQRLSKVPRRSVPMANFERVKNQILDRIAIPKEESSSALASFLSFAPRFLKVGAMLTGCLLLAIGLTFGVASAALQSVPGSPIYPVKKIVENVQMQLANTDTEKADLQIKFANTRLEELQKVLEQNQQGKVSGAQVQKLVENTISNTSKTATSVNEKNNSGTTPPTNILSKLVDLNNKQTALLQSASIKSEGEVKIEIDKALAAAEDAKKATIANMEKAGLKVEDQPITLNDPKKDEAQAHGKITQLSNSSITIGSSKFLLTKDTKFVNIKQDELKIGQTAVITGKIDQSNTYALEVKFESATPNNPTPNPSPDKSDTSGSGQ